MKNKINLITAEEMSRQRYFYVYFEMNGKEIELEVICTQDNASEMDLLEYNYAETYQLTEKEEKIIDEYIDSFNWNEV